MAPLGPGRAGRSRGSGCGSRPGSGAATRDSSRHGNAVGRPAPRRSTAGGPDEDGDGGESGRRDTASAGAELRASVTSRSVTRYPTSGPLLRMDPGWWGGECSGGPLSEGKTRMRSHWRWRLPGWRNVVMTEALRPTGSSPSRGTDFGTQAWAPDPLVLGFRVPCSPAAGAPCSPIPMCPRGAPLRLHPLWATSPPYILSATSAVASAGNQAG